MRAASASSIVVMLERNTGPGSAVGGGVGAAGVAGGAGVAGLAGVAGVAGIVGDVRVGDGCVGDGLVAPVVTCAGPEATPGRLAPV